MTPSPARSVPPEHFLALHALQDSAWPAEKLGAFVPIEVAALLLSARVRTRLPDERGVLLRALRAASGEEVRELRRAHLLQTIWNFRRPYTLGRKDRVFHTKEDWERNLVEMQEARGDISDYAAFCSLLEEARTPTPDFEANAVVELVGYVSNHRVAILTCLDYYLDVGL